VAAVHKQSAKKGVDMRLRLSQVALTTVAVALLAGSGAFADNKHQGRQHGYEHGYRDGFHHGREDQERHLAFTFDTDDYKHGDRGYDKYMGDRGDYKEGYRTGYQSGYNDGFYSRPGRFGEIYGREDSFEGRRYRDDFVLEGRPGGYPDIAFDDGYRDGVRDGEKDLRNHDKFDPSDHDSYRDADRHFNSSFGDKELYKRYYRDGFLRGYQDGYGRWR
jgi:hypothetical protein